MPIFAAIRRNKFVLPAAIAVVGVLFQLAFMFLGPEGPGGLSWYDSNDYYKIARDLSWGEPYSTAENTGNLYRSPGYPFLLSLMMRVAGESVAYTRLFHIVLFPFFLLVIYSLGSRLFNRRVGVLAMLFSTVYPLFVYIPLAFYPESLLLYLYPAIALLVFLARERPSYLKVGLLGLSVALAIMIRPTAVIWLPVCLYYLLAGKPFAVRRAVAVCSVVILIPALFVGAWMFRNNRVHGTYIFTTSGSWNLLTSYNENATWYSKSMVEIPAEIQEKLDRAKTVAERESVKKSEAIKFIRNNPGRALKIVSLHCLQLWNPIPQTSSTGGMAQSKFKLASGIPYVVLLPFGIVGLVMTRKNLFTKTLVLLLVINTLVNGIVAVSIRYRAITDFVFILTAAYVADILLRKLGDSRKQSAGANGLRTAE